MGRANITVRNSFSPINPDTITSKGGGEVVLLLPPEEVLVVGFGVGVITVCPLTTTTTSPVRTCMSGERNDSFTTQQLIIYSKEEGDP